MTPITLAKKIPDEVRSERLLTDADPIGRAIAVASNPAMQLLSKVWYQYIEPQKEPTTCLVCLQNILNGFKAIKPILINLEKDYKLIKAL